ncbi:cytochrome c/c1 heme lyase [Achlya hypogyna]|uniref:Holocytochrome c-type synthase n=1 Tax=Achlya hypogyna TaxID=1202772 RepID=A0A1V9YHJ0_ACHHY|nr:cytochrome c/c1 heme lyase [Achlya hypogyna]
MGNSTSTPTAPAAPAAAPAGCPVKHDTPASGCPVKHEAPAPVSAEGGCPVKKKGPVYNVYNQEIDPTNMMPLNPNQEPKEGQKYPLDTNRVQSTIPKGGTEGTWTYPSEQMFFNALKRKGKGEDVHEGHINTIVSIHNNMNERAWEQVAAYEEACHPGSETKLLRFMGRPDDLTPLARLKLMLGHGKPFDRHDWIVIRKDGTEVRYVIDYYFDEAKTAEDKVPELHDATSVKSISMYARPAIDDIGSLVDRIKYPILDFINGQRNPVLPKHTPSAEEPESTPAPGDKLSVADVEETFGKIQAKCKSCFVDVKTCETDEKCAQAATALQFCMATILCKPQAAQFTAALASGDEAKIQAAYEAMGTCVENFEDRARDAMALQARLALEKASK